MKVVYFADFASPFARDWMVNASRVGDLEVIAVCSRTGRRWIPSESSEDSNAVREASTVGSRISAIRTRVPLAVAEIFRNVRARRQVATLLAAVAEFEPDLVHSLRLTYEGIVAGAALGAVPHVVSVWGNDFTLHGERSSVRRQLALLGATVAGLTADTERDLTLAVEFGFGPEVPKLALPSSLGTPELFFSSPSSNQVTDFAAGRSVICYPRGVRSYAHPELFVEAMASLESSVCGVMVGIPDAHPAHAHARSLGLDGRLLILGQLERATFAEVLSASDIVVSPTSHDGTPNSILEAMAAGCYPVVSDLPSLHEWITDGENGNFFDLHQGSIDRALRLALQTARADAVAFNRDMVERRSGETACRRQLYDFYGRVSS